MDLVKEAFQKVRQDIDSLKEEVSFLRKNLIETRESMISLCGIIKDLEQKIAFFKEKDEKLDSSTPTHNLENSAVPTHNPTHPTLFKPLKEQNLGISTGNGGVPTDRQTDRQTDQHTEKPLKNTQNPLDNAAEFLESLDSIKKEIRIKFKGLTEQELLVFSTIYQMDDENGFTTYRDVAKRLQLTESSIRDYVGRLTKKGIPVEKKKINNKTIQISVSKNLKKIASLSTILQLREL